MHVVYFNYILACFKISTVHLSNLSLILQNTGVYLSVCIPHTLKALALVVSLVFKLYVVSLVSSDRILHKMANS